jgi:hypothetical protein
MEPRENTFGGNPHFLRSHCYHFELPDLSKCKVINQNTGVGRKSLF